MLHGPCAYKLSYKKDFSQNMTLCFNYWRHCIFLVFIFKASKQKWRLPPWSESRHVRLASVYNPINRRPCVSSETPNPVYVWQFRSNYSYEYRGEVLIIAIYHTNESTVLIRLSQSTGNLVLFAKLVKLLIGNQYPSQHHHIMRYSKIPIKHDVHFRDSNRFQG